ncbi:head-tail joining protein [Sphingomonas dokdonensis]|uniref:Uncharacterized protein n=1 Tax=Sphingomonas dokdonensis TaxID=344880 RepID=A0A245ZHI3_9SPHN|nr:hypothetical protein [Sphingomonas dokdonensis]OWK29205.1 hypothetical protein SPDO_21860 [Sphingomonas dokdonensis]
MDDPFAAALDALFEMPGSAAAVYQPIAGTPPFPIRVIRAQPDELGPRGVIQATNHFDIRRSDVAHPQRGDVVAIGGAIQAGAITGGEMFELIGTPMSDVEGLTWTIGADQLRD